MRVKSVFIVLVVALVFQGCASSSGSAPRGKKMILLSEGMREKTFKATSIVFSVSAQPMVRQNEFTSDVSINVRGDIKSYRFVNHFKAAEGSKTNTVMVAISGHEGGFGIYNEFGAPLAEYSHGKVFGNALIFDVTRDNGTSRIKWFFGENTIASVIETSNASGQPIYSEVTTYRPR